MLLAIDGIVHVSLSCQNLTTSLFYSSFSFVHLRHINKWSTINILAIHMLVKILEV